MNFLIDYVNQSNEVEGEIKEGEGNILGNKYSSLWPTWEIILIYFIIHFF